MADTHTKAPAQVDELNPREIFAEINSEIGTDKKSYTPRQKTRLNYTYVILLNIILLIAVSLGVLAVYRIFREQGIRMTEGTGGIQSLEILLLEQESRRQTLELQEKEAQLRQVQRAYTEIENQLAAIRSDIQGQVNLELNRQRTTLEQQVQQDLLGKTAAEQQAIRQQYQQDIQRLQTEAQQEVDRRVDEAITNRRREIDRMRAEQQLLEKDLSSIKERLLVQEQTILTQIQPAPVYDDSHVSLLYNVVEVQLRQGNYNEVERQLKKIEDIYLKPAPESKKAADLFLVSLIRDYIKVSNNNSTLLAQLIDVTNSSLSNQNRDMASFRLMIEEISRLVKENPQNPAIARRIRALQEEAPEAFIFYNAYHTYLVQEDVRRATPLLRQAEQAFTRRNYPQAVSIYQNILNSYPNIPNQQTILDGLYRALQAQSSSGQTNTYTNIDTKKTNLVYMKAPDGYVYDMGAENIIISLLPGIVVKPRTAINIFRVDPKNGFQLSLIGTGTIIEGKGSFVSARASTNIILLGDLIYITK